MKMFDWKRNRTTWALQMSCTHFSLHNRDCESVSTTVLFFVNLVTYSYFPSEMV